MDKLHKRFYSTFLRKINGRRLLSRSATVEDAHRHRDDENTDSVGQPLASRVVVPAANSASQFLRDIGQLCSAVWRLLAARIRPSVILLMCIAFGVGVGVSNWLKRHPLKQVTFESDFVHVTPEVLAPRLSGLLDTSLFELNLTAIRSQLMAVPWVAQVSLRRLWPDGLQISITEKKVRAKWGKDGFISDKGVIFEAPLTPAAAAFSAYLPELMGNEDDVHNLLDYYEQMSVALVPVGLDIVALTRGSRYWQITLSNNIRVLVNHNQVLDKLIRFRHVYEQLGERQAQVASADLRYHHGVAITWWDATSTDVVSPGDAASGVVAPKDSP